MPWKSMRGKIEYRSDTPNSSTLLLSTQPLPSDTIKSNLRHFHIQHQILGYLGRTENVGDM